MHEETVRMSIYFIRSQDLLGLDAEGVTAMTTHPIDAYLLIIAYDTCPAVLLWDFKKRKVVRELTLTDKASNSVFSRQSSTYELSCNSQQCLSGHSSGKRFVAGYKHEGFAIFRMEINYELHRCMAEIAEIVTNKTDLINLCFTNVETSWYFRRY